MCWLPKHCQPWGCNRRLQKGAGSVMAADGASQAGYGDDASAGQGMNDVDTVYVPILDEDRAAVRWIKKIPIQGILRGDNLGVQIRHADFALPEIRKSDPDDVALLTKHMKKDAAAEKLVPAAILSGTDTQVTQASKELEPLELPLDVKKHFFLLLLKKNIEV